ncbi:flagellar basal-body rod protein FlgG [Providencia sneebia]|uniref:Flagellar basal-body rod protein FlgG n=1 Tax=Providencia sneebia DSM 19967 TaxID=1141660 RepID=K8WF58_9GAMM|nr:flagellar basal-body rod protein FlgG [Providencia sneebia]EKT58561.1 flagellar basal-body rod protein FlgG [Providencia sneebia DSM 19967]
MPSALDIAKTGLNSQQTNLDVIANNLANASTNAYKVQHALYEDLPYQNLRQPGAMNSKHTLLPSGLQIGTGSRLVATSHIHSQGNLKNTGVSTHIAINGKGFLEVKMPDGSSAFTRDGALQSNQYGMLEMASNGYQIESNIVIPENATNITIAQDGTVSATILGESQPQIIGELKLTTFMNESGLESLGGNLYRETASSGVANIGIAPGTEGAGVLRQGMLETSNVNVAEQLVNMIETQRAYELNSKVISTADQMLQRLTQI